MFLYNLTIQKATAITHAIKGYFSGTKTQEIVISKGKILELLSVDHKTGKVHTLLTYDVFGIIRSLMPFRLPGSPKEYIVIGSDSAKIVVLSYSQQKNVFEKIHEGAFSKTVDGRFVVTGQYLATDPRGRALMIGAVERQKTSFAISKDDQGKVTVSSPLEADNSNALLYHMVVVDVGIHNPIFACLQVDYDEECDASKEIPQKKQQLIVFYELDLGANQVVRKYSEVLEDYANLLIAVPGDRDGPSGVLICSENYLTYMKLGDQPNVHCRIPRRGNDLDEPERGIIFVCSATYASGSTFFFMVQTEQGDIFKITLETDGDTVKEIKLKYFDTVPVATALCILKTGLLFVASEFGNQ